MSGLFSRFTWPLQSGSTVPPEWTGSGFRIADRIEPVLRYDEIESNWSDELTRMHEQEAGRAHPIDLASRGLAIHTLKVFCGDKQDAVALEVGCSSGYLLEDICREIPHLALVGADYIAQPLEALAPRIPSVPLLQFDLRRCPLHSESVDAVVLLNVLEHIDDDMIALKEVARILKPRGIAHIEVPSNPDCYDIYDEHLLHHRRYRLKELISMSEQEGFEVLKATHLGFFVYPAFYAVKQRNKKLLSLPRAEKESKVAQQIRETRGNAVFSAVMKMEMLLGQVISYPAGIRCVVVLQKKV